MKKAIIKAMGMIMSCVVAFSAGTPVLAAEEKEDVHALAESYEAAGSEVAGSAGAAFSETAADINIKTDSLNTTENLGTGSDETVDRIEAETQRQIEANTQASEAMKDFTGDDDVEGMVLPESETEEAGETLYADATNFTDVQSDKYYTQPIAWAVENDITSGTSATTFGINDTCTRAQIVTFLWKLAGSPEPRNVQTAFTDVPTDAWYSKAIAWAVENNISTGKNATTFDRNGKCTRAQIMTFLYKYKGASFNTPSIFTDVPEGKFYMEPVMWGYVHGITTGTSDTTFGPNVYCTRAQAVTFLYNAAQDDPAHPFSADVTVFGATPDDDQNDTGAIKYAINRMQETGRTILYFPAGVYDCKANSSLGGTIHFDSHKGDNVKIILDKNAILRVGAGTVENQHTLIYIRDCDNVLICGGQLQGDRSIGSGDHDGKGIEVDDSSNITIKDMTISNFRGDSIYLGNATWGSDTGVSNVKISNIQSPGNTRHGLVITYGNNITIENSNFSNNGGEGQSCGITVESNYDNSGNFKTSRNITVSNCTLNNNANYGFYVYTPAYNINLTNCTISGNRGAGANYQVLLYRAYDFHMQNCNINGQTMSNSGSYGDWKYFK